MEISLDRHEIESLEPSNADLAFAVEASANFSLQLEQPSSVDVGPVGGNARWADDAVSTDYRHLGEAISHESFSISAKTVEALIDANGFSGWQLMPEDRYVLFGLRGAMRVDNADRFASQVEIVEAVPDHQNYRCVIGVLDRQQQEIAVFPASTVPNWRAMALYRDTWNTSNPIKSNCLQTGVYRYTVGTHRQYLHGALIDTYKRAVLRSRPNTIYDHNDFWDAAHVGDNIHPGHYDRRPDNDHRPKFSSFGCQVIPGSYRRSGQKHLRDWAIFRKRCGLDNEKPKNDFGRKFPYVLLTAREARLASDGQLSDLKRLRQGAFGPGVRAIQRALVRKSYLRESDVDSKMGADTIFGLTRWQNDYFGRADGIVSFVEAEALGVAADF